MFVFPTPLISGKVTEKKLNNHTRLYYGILGEIPKVGNTFKYNEVTVNEYFILINTETRNYIFI